MAIITTFVRFGQGLENKELGSKNMLLRMSKSKERVYFISTFLMGIVVGYNLERWWAGWKQFVRRQGCAFGKKLSAHHTRLKTLVSRYAPLMSITRLSLSRTVTFFFSAAAAAVVVVSSYPPFFSLLARFLLVLSLLRPFSFSHTRDFFAFSPHIPPTPTASCAM